MHRSSQAAAITILLILASMMVMLVIQAWPTLKTFGPAFLVDDRWDPAQEHFGAWVPIVGTLVTSIMALLLAVPISLGIAIFLTELAPNILRKPLGIAIELLAAIPSIVYGMWGLFVFAPLFAEYIQEPLGAWFEDVPVLGSWFSGPPMGIGLLTASIVLAVMIIPYIAAVMRDVFAVVPPLMKESAYGLGCTTWEVIWHVVIPYTKGGILGGIMLGLGRALGETMAVTFVIGNSNHLEDFSLFSLGNSITSILANQFPEASLTGLHQPSLMALGLVLFVITFTVLSLAKIMLHRLKKQEGAHS
jgi:phosphate transport system permease protein